MTALGIIAGGGDLPRAIAENVSASGRKVCIIALTGSAEDWVTSYPHEWAGMGEANKINGFLRAQDCKDVLLAGKVARPKWSEIKVDTRGALRLPGTIAAALKGDDALLRHVVSLFESDGFRVVGAAEAAPGMIAIDGTIGRLKPGEQDQKDIQLAFAVVRKLGELDVGQAAAVCSGLTLAVEAAEGTDAMIARIKDLPAHLRGTPAKPRGVLVKAPKPIQDGKTDLPVIGVQTIRNAADAGLAGIAVETGGALIVDKAAVATAADAAGLFVIGVPRST
ncbi:MAG TPA: UDP-2,3-diacylglucosamine diphosphatase LpxI [Rhizomicrobium sp.]|nr:UDP-2,3-diacylglucosamine diphosphatase LpxI [Rhizomicrobium sp.]